MKNIVCVTLGISIVSMLNNAGQWFDPCGTQVEISVCVHMIEIIDRK